MSAGTFNQPPAGYGQPPQQVQARETSGKATASLVLGILAVLLFVVWASFIFGPLAIVFGVMGRNEIKANPMKGGYGTATAGMVCGIIGIALTVVFAAIGFATM
jgi:hypothetical protein